MDVSVLLDALRDPDWANVFLTALIALIGGIWTVYAFRRNQARNNRATPEETNGHASRMHAQTSDTTGASGRQNAAQAIQYAIPASPTGSSVVDKTPDSNISWQWRSKVAFILRNTGTFPVTVTGVANSDEFVLISLDLPATLEPMRSITGTAMGAWGTPLPGEAVLNTDSGTIVCPIPARTH